MFYHTHLYCYVYYVHSNDIENHNMFTPSNTCSLLTITQHTADQYYSYMYFTNLHDQASLLPKEIETLTYNKSWPECLITNIRKVFNSVGVSRLKRQLGVTMSIMVESHT